MKNCIQKHGPLTKLAPAGGVVGGGGYLIDGLFVVAVATAAAGEEFAAEFEGVFTLPKASGVAWVEGMPLYWDTANARLSTLATVGPMVARADADATSGATTGEALLLEGASGLTYGVKEGSPAPAAINTAGAATYTAAQLLGGLILRDPAGAARTDVLPTAALLVAELAARGGAKVGAIVETLVINTADAAEEITIDAGTGGAWGAGIPAAAKAIAQNTSKRLILRITDVTAEAEAYVVYA